MTIVTFTDEEQLETFADDTPTGVKCSNVDITPSTENKFFMFMCVATGTKATTEKVASYDFSSEWNIVILSSNAVTDYQAIGIMFASNIEMAGWQLLFDSNT